MKQLFESDRYIDILQRSIFSFRRSLFVGTYSIAAPGLVLDLRNPFRGTRARPARKATRKLAIVTAHVELTGGGAVFSHFVG
jgi:hypothetical protein